MTDFLVVVIVLIVIAAFVAVPVVAIRRLLRALQRPAGTSSSDGNDVVTTPDERLTTGPAKPSTTTCPQCGGTIPSAAHKCMHCGSQTPRGLRLSCLIAIALLALFAWWADLPRLLMEWK